MKSASFLKCILCALAFCGASNSRALTYEELHQDNTVTAETFASRFADFKFVFGVDVQRPQDFLAAKAGDCDDYSTLAAAELSARGYHTRLVSVRLKHVVHVVCYVEEAAGYLDYNLRGFETGIMPCGPDLHEMADLVARTFDSSWTSVSEFTFTDGVKRLVSTTYAKAPHTRTALLNTGLTRQ